MLIQLIADLTNPRPTPAQAIVRAVFARTPEEVMREYGLKEAQKRAVLSRNLDDLLPILAQEAKERNPDDPNW